MREKLVATKAKEAKEQSTTKVRRIKSEAKEPRIKPMRPIYDIGRYLKGSWQELRQVRWPNRRAAWGMTAAVILFTAFFVALITLLDWGFNQLFKVIIK